MKTLLRLEFVCLFIAAVMFSGCAGKASNVTTNANTDIANSNKAVTTMNTSTPSSANAPATTSLSTPTDSYKTAYALREKKDVEGLKRVMSKDVMEFFEMMAKEEKKTVNEELAQMFEKPQAKSPEVRNEKITGDTATIEYLDADGSWKPMDFVKEGSDWKMTIPKAEKSAPPK